MSGEVLDGKKLGNELRINMKEEVTQLKKKNIVPHLTVVLVGEDPASKSYVNGKKKASSEVGISSDVIELPVSTKEEQLIQLIDRLNVDSSVHGILVQLHLPIHIDEHEYIETISSRI